MACDLLAEQWALEDDGGRAGGILIASGESRRPQLTTAATVPRKVTWVHITRPQKSDGGYVVLPPDANDPMRGGRLPSFMFEGARLRTEAY